jgi:hypothetical protein
LLQPTLVVAWLQFSNKGYFSRLCSLRTALTNRRLLKTVLLCLWPPRQGPGPPFAGCLPADPLTVSELTLSSSRLILYNLWADPTEKISSCSYSVDVRDVFHCGVTVCLASDRVENTAPSGTSVIACATVATLTWHSQSRSLATAACAGATILAFSRHATIYLKGNFMCVYVYYIFRPQNIANYINSGFILFTLMLTPNTFRQNRKLHPD